MRTVRSMSKKKDVAILVLNVLCCFLLFGKKKLVLHVSAKCAQVVFDLCRKMRNLFANL